MADVAIVNPATATAPKDYRLQLNQLLAIKAVKASFDGTGAAASYLPCLQLLAPDGTVMWDAVPALTTAAGASVDATWFPHIGLSSIVVGGATIQSYWGNATAADFTWTGPGGTNVSSGFPVNNTFTKLIDSSGLLIIFEGDFTAGAASDNLTLGLWLNGANRINVATGTVGNAFASVQGASLRGITGDPVSFPAGAYTLDMRVSSFLGQTTTFRCSTSATLTIQELTF